MFKRPVQFCERGDRLGMCVAQLDHNLMERGLVSAPRTVPTFNAAICVAEKIRFHKQKVGSKMKFHVTVSISPFTTFRRLTAHTRLRFLFTISGGAPNRDGDGGVFRRGTGGRRLGTRYRGGRGKAVTGIKRD
jgi:hypothetical protein